MFTGIIESTGVIKASRPTAGGRVLEIKVGPLAAECALGASVCVSGVCLTVAERGTQSLTFDIITETLSRSTLGAKSVGEKVNLERSLGVGDRLDGHFVQGHVDGVATVDRVLSTAREHVVWLRTSPEVLTYVIPKGSIALDGVSLTIAEKQNEAFSVALIPTTLKLTTLSGLSAGQQLNVETDILCRTVIHTMKQMSMSDGLQWSTLREAGMAP